MFSEGPGQRIQKRKRRHLVTTMLRETLLYVRDLLMDSVPV
jgi:hypothetical protein